jgi:hypothetical protein
VEAPFDQALSQEEDLEGSTTREELLGGVSKNIILDGLKKSNDDSRKEEFTKSLLRLFANNPIPFKMIEKRLREYLSRQWYLSFI